MLNAVWATIIKLFGPDYLIIKGTKKELVIISFDWEAPWKNYWGTKGTMSSGSLAPLHYLLINNSMGTHVDPRHWMHHWVRGMDDVIKLNQSIQSIFQTLLRDESLSQISPIRVNLRSFTCNVWAVSISISLFLSLVEKTCSHWSSW